MPKSMVVGAAAGAAALGVSGAVVLGKASQENCAAGKLIGAALTAGSVGAGAFAIYSHVAHRAFSYDGRRQLSKQIVEGTAGYVTLPAGGVGLDVGCGSGALTIACAKRNPDADLVGCDIWSGAYKTVFSQRVCETNAKAEGVANVRFVPGNAVKLPFADESFDAVTSNYVYHNIVGHDKQKLLMETLRVLKKGGTFAIHDLMSEARYGDMAAFVRLLKEQGCEDVRLIDTTRGLFMGRAEAILLGLGGSKLLVGRK
ncbi:MAG: class I SAM-dependent methyltransferase [Oscillospiraceae bacterium]|nr:class I SAM-dependent methyltransferase [Oscillospiraceae bacterium]